MTTAPTPVVIGRDEELDALRRFLVGPATAVMVIDGEPGSGKTILWEATVASCSSRVLACRPTEAEAALAFAGVGDLLDGLLPDALGVLPGPQRNALEVALLLADPSLGALDPRALGVAFLGVLRGLAETEALLIAIDDVQWLDSASAALLEFAARRLRAEPIRILLARRRGEASFVDVIEGPHVQQVALGPLDAAAIQLIITSHGLHALPAALVARLQRASEGNPFYALEIARAIERGGGATIGGELPLPSRVQQVVQDRIRALPREAGEPLLACALLADPTVGLIDAAVGADGLDPAIAAAVIASDGSRIRFTHPLLGAAVRVGAAPSRRRKMHRRLAELVGDGEERARHLAAAATGPAESVAAELDAAVAAAATRGAYASAAELGELALRLTAESDPASRARRLRTAEHQLAAGYTTRVGALLEPMLDDFPEGPERADALLLLAYAEQDMARALSRLDDALEQAGDDLARRVDIQRERVGAALICGGARAGAIEADLAVELAERLGDPARLASVLGEAAVIRLAVGQPAVELVERAVRLEQQHHALARPAKLNAARVLMWRDRGDEARALFSEVIESARERGDELVLADALFHRAELNLRESRYVEARHDALEVLAAASGTDQPQVRSAGLYVLAFAQAYLGATSEARRCAHEGIARSRETHDEVFWVQNEAALGFIELSLGDDVAADRHLRPLWPMLASLGYGEPGVFPVLPNAVEALIGLAALDEAETLLSELEGCGARLDSPWALSQAARCRGALTAARGKGEGALMHFEQAFAQLDRTCLPFERGRTELAQGVALRRMKRRREARASLDRAVTTFSEIGALLWERRARAELARIGGRAPGERGLTASEQRLAELVATGLSNKEAAAELFVSVNTVEKSLSRIYAKLGIHSRTALAARLPEVTAAEGDPPPATRSSS